MDKYIDARFDRVEKALTTLIDSIAKYNPSTALAEDLLAADKELSQGLETLQTHQNNHLRILALRADVTALDAQIKSALLALAGSRRDILTTPATVFPEDSPNRYVRRQTHNYEFRYDQLMSYARRISRNTVPAPGQTDGAAFFGPFDGGEGAGGPAEAAATVGTSAATPAATPGPLNGVGTPSAAAAGGAQNPSQMELDTPVAAAGGAGSKAVGGGGSGGNTTAGTSAGTPGPLSGMAPPANVPDVLPADYQQYIAPAAGTVFFPWPMPDLMRTGALRSLQAVTDSQSEKLGGAASPSFSIRFVSLEEQQEEERQRAAREAEEREAWEERQRQMAEEAAAAGGFGGSQPTMAGAARPGGPAAAAAPAQFASTLDMDDD
ncbi:mediator of RNA polymerase 2 transcription subunit 4 [Niveomyces insectorum RCEF 264]|uniref:Mediator of RNA polymerase II transcription subunit 4 n=1 Tax=Niveomyces insectorum RCEF 264 TaxID=1081102 RepID=A0A167YPP2_9HYPO|nr:mediator of RNA polymerase 2 transcription subunit 4 [Niveomyces insectorum RCEF 264]